MTALPWPQSAPAPHRRQILWRGGSTCRLCFLPPTLSFTSGSAPPPLQHRNGSLEGHQGPPSTHNLGASSSVPSSTHNLILLPFALWNSPLWLLPQDTILVHAHFLAPSPPYCVSLFSFFCCPAEHSQSICFLLCLCSLP